MFFRFQKNFLNNYKLNIIEKNNYILYNRVLYISPLLVNKTLKVYTGNFFFNISIKEKMLSFNIKDFIFTKKKAVFKKTLKKK